MLPNRHCLAIAVVSLAWALFAAAEARAGPLTLLASAEAPGGSFGASSLTNALPMKVVPRHNGASQVSEERGTPRGIRGNPKNDPVRALSTPAALRAYYVGGVQKIIDRTCGHKFPVSVRASCRGTNSTIQLQGTTVFGNEPIPCYLLSGSEAEEGWAEMRCLSNTLYQSADEDSSNFAEIYFSCTSEDSVEARFIYENTGPGGYCGFGSGRYGVARNYRVAQLGVLCTNDNGYSYDPAFFECALNNFVNDPNGRYTCHYGQNERYRDIIEWEDVIVETDVYRFRDDCIAVLDGNGNEILGAVPPRPPAPAIAPSPMGTYRAKFRTAFFLRESDYSSIVMQGPSAVTVRCTTPGSRIFFVSSGDPSLIQCTLVAIDTLTCTSTEYSNRFFTVSSFGWFDYECESPALPEVESTYGENAISYDSPFASEWNFAYNYLSMAVFCGGATNYEDYYFQCPDDPGITWSQWFQDGLGSIPICAGPGFYNTTNRFEFNTIPEFSMRTDYRWSQSASADCYEFSLPAPTMAPSLSTAPSVVPSEVPSASPSRSLSPSFNPSSEPSTNPSLSQSPTSLCESIPPFQVEIAFEHTEGDFPLGASHTISRRMTRENYWCNAHITAVSTLYYQGDFSSSSEWLSVQFLTPDGTVTIASTSGQSDGDCDGEQAVAPLSCR